MCVEVSYRGLGLFLSHPLNMENFMQKRTQYPDFIHNILGQSTVKRKGDENRGGVYLGVMANHYAVVDGTRSVHKDLPLIKPAFLDADGKVGVTEGTILTYVHTWQGCNTPQQCLAECQPTNQTSHQPTYLHASQQIHLYRDKISYPSRILTDAEVNK